MIQHVNPNFVLGSTADLIFISGLQLQNAVLAQLNKQKVRRQID